MHFWMMPTSSDKSKPFTVKDKLHIWWACPLNVLKIPSLLFWVWRGSVCCTSHSSSQNILVAISSTCSSLVPAITDRRRHFYDYTGFACRHVSRGWLRFSSSVTRSRRALLLFFFILENSDILINANHYFADHACGNIRLLRSKRGFQQSGDFGYMFVV